MDKKKIEIAGSILLVVIFLVISVSSIKTIAAKRQAENAVRAAKMLPPAISLNTPKPKEPQAPNLADFEGPIYRDPFKRQATPERLNEDIKKSKKINGVAGILITGIVYDKLKPDKSYCIINGEVLRRDETIDDYTVTDIKENLVALFNKKENKEYKLRLWEEEADSL